MKMLWCWRCKAVVPMLDDAEWERLNPLLSQGLRDVKAYREAHGARLEDTPRAQFFQPALEEHERITGIRASDFDALMHHRLSRLGPPCRMCGRRLRTPKAKLCGACMTPRALERLAPCPRSPNCCCSQEADPRHAIEPFYFSGDVARARAALVRAVLSLPRTRIVLDEPLRLRAECRSKVFRFVDDLELLIVPDGMIHVRSASRVGHSDFGVNRRRVERLRAAFETSRRGDAT